MSTPSHERKSSSPATKRVTSQNADNQSELHKGNTPNAIKRLSLKRCKCMIWFLYIVITLKLGILILIMMARLTHVIQSWLPVLRTHKQKVNTQTQNHQQATWHHTQGVGLHMDLSSSMCAPPVQVTLSLTNSCNQIYLVYLIWSLSCCGTLRQHTL